VDAKQRHPANGKHFSSPIVDGVPDMAATRKEHLMNPLSPNTINRICLAGAAALVLAAAADACTLHLNDSSMVATYGWGAAATYAKQQTRTALNAPADNDLVAQYGWGAAAAYAKLHS